MTTSSHTSCAVGVARRGLSLIAFILSVTASLALAQTAGTIAGRVTDDSNKAAVSGASVTITGTNQETSTNQQGEFVLVNVPGGDTSVTVNYLGLATKTMPVTVRPGEVSRLDVVMAQEVVQRVLCLACLSASKMCCSRMTCRHNTTHNYTKTFIPILMHPASPYCVRLVH